MAGGGDLGGLAGGGGGDGGKSGGGSSGGGGSPDMTGLGGPGGDMAFGGPPGSVGFDPGNAYTADQGAGAAPGGGTSAPSTFSDPNVGAPVSQQAAPGTTPTSIGGTPSGTQQQGYGGGSPTQQQDQSGQLGQALQQAVKMLQQGGKQDQQQAGGGPSAISPTLDQLAQGQQGFGGGSPTQQATNQTQLMPTEVSAPSVSQSDVPTNAIPGSAPMVPGDKFSGGQTAPSAPPAPPAPSAQASGAPITLPPGTRENPGNVPVDIPAPLNQTPTTPSVATTPTPPSVTTTPPSAAPTGGGLIPQRGISDVIQNLMGSPRQLEQMATQAGAPTTAPSATDEGIRQAIASGAQQNPDGSITANNGLPGSLVQNAPAADQGFGASNVPEQQNRPARIAGPLSMGNGNYHFVTGGGRFNSLPFGQYHVNPGQIGPDGRRIGAIAGVSDASTGNTVHDPTYTGSDGTHSRGGIEIHPLDSRNITNGCVGIPRSEWSQFSQAFNQMRAQGQPIVLNHTPQGITIGPAQAPQTAQTAQTAQGPESEDAMYARTVNEIETSSKGGRGGLGNFGSEGPKYGLTPQNQNDPKAVQEAYRQERADKGPKFEQRVGRKPSLNEHYVMHQQGLEGGIALYQQPNELAAKVLAPFYGSEAQAAKIIQANGGNPQGTAKNFTDMWEARFNRNQRGTQPPAPPPSQAPQRLPPQIDTPGRQGSVQPNQQIAFAGGGPSSNPDVNRMMEQRLDARRPPGDDVPGLLAPSDLDRAMRPSDDRYNLGTERVLPTPPGHDRNVIPIDPGDQWQQQAFNSDPRRSPWDRQANHPGFTAPNAPLGDRDAGGFQDPGAYRPQIGPAPRSMQQQPWPDQPPPEDDDPITNYNENPQQIPPRNDYPIPQKGSRQEQAQLEQYLARLFGLDWV